jgi:hypothetical protein
VDDRKKWVLELHKDNLDGKCTIEVFLEFFKDWNFDYIYKSDELIGASFHKDGFIHIVIAPEHRKFWAKKNQIKRLISNAMIDGKAYTTIFKNDEYRTTFAKRLGFKLLEDGEIQIYEVKHENLWK